MKFISTAVLCLAALGTAAAQPVVTGIVNAANYSPGIAQGSIFVVFGTNMGPAQLVQVPAFPVPSTLSGTSIRFTPVAGGPAYDALVVYTSAGQLAGILQSPAPVGDYNVTVAYNGQTSAPFRTTVVSRNFGLISLSGTGTGPAVIQNFVSASELRVNQFGSPARPGQTLILYGIGLGPITAPDNNPPGLQDLKGPTNLRVLVGDAEIEPLYAGRSPGIPGLDQINFVLPANVSLGCAVPLRVRVAGTFTGAFTTLAIARAGDNFCTHPLYSEAVLRRIEAGGTVSLGSLSVASQTIFFDIPILGSRPVKNDAANGSFSMISLANIADVTNTETAGLFVNIGSCNVFRVQADQNARVVGGNTRRLDAGTSLTLNGPGITNRAMSQTPANSRSYTAILSDAASSILPGIVLPGQPAPVTISPGTFTIAGTGGADIGPFTASLRVPTPIVWTNQTSFSTVIRSSGLTVNWTGGEATDVITILGSSGVRGGGTQANPIFDTTTFVCTARGDAGSFNVPAAVLTQLPASTGNFTDGTGVGILAVSQSTASEANGRFSAPLRAGGNIDLGLFTYSIGGLATITWR
ncbi:MAG: hypothetical protein K2X03_06290 [Bryobacteraceae bacterium]|nr:hypothetical protein [Bryobacteraceae bacterium]